jgi:ribosomal protein S27AE
MFIMPSSDFKYATRKVTLKQERCPKCDALLFRADAEGEIEIKCRKCGYVVKRELRRVDRMA